MHLRNQTIVENVIHKKIRLVINFLRRPIKKLKPVANLSEASQ